MSGLPRKRSEQRLNFGERTPVKPVRSCLVCRGKENKGGLLRVVWRGGELVLDRERKLQGRGAYLHVQCSLMLPPPEVWSRAFRLGKGSVTKEILAQFRARLKEE